MKFRELIISNKPCLSEKDFIITLENGDKLDIQDLIDGGYIIKTSKNEVISIKRDNLIKDIVLDKKIATMGNLLALLTDLEIKETLKNVFTPILEKYDAEFRKIEVNFHYINLKYDLDVSLELGEQGVMSSKSFHLGDKNLNTFIIELEDQIKKDSIWSLDFLDSDIVFILEDIYLKAINSKGFAKSNFTLPKEVLEKIPKLKDSFIKSLGGIGIKKAFLSDSFIGKIRKSLNIEDVKKIFTMANKSGFVLYAGIGVFSENKIQKVVVEDVYLTEDNKIGMVLQGENSVRMFTIDNEQVLDNLFFGLDLDKQINDYYEKKAEEKEKTNKIQLNNVAENETENKKEQLLNDLEDSTFGHKIIFLESKASPLIFKIKLKLKKSNGKVETRSIGTIKIPKNNTTPVVFETRRISTIHYMIKLNAYGFNYKLLDYLITRFSNQEIIVKIQEDDTGKVYYTTAKKIFDAKKNNVLNFNGQGFETQIFYDYDIMRNDTEDYNKSVKK